MALKNIPGCVYIIAIKIQMTDETAYWTENQE
jgi:hypothetical protein